MRKQQTRKPVEISPKCPVRQVNSLSTIFLTNHNNIWCIWCLWTSRVVESSGDNTTAFYTPEVSNSGNLASCRQEKGLQNFNTALLFHCSIEASFLQLIIWICKQKEKKRGKIKKIKRHLQLNCVSPWLQLLRQDKKPKFPPSTKTAMASFFANLSRDRMGFQTSVYDQRAAAYDKYLYGPLNNSLYKYYSKCVCWKPQTSQFILKQMC